MRFVGIATAFVAAVLGTAPVSAQEYPSKPVTLVVPFAAGGSNDMLARFLGEQLGKKWGQPVVVENRPGAGSAIGAAFVSQSPADGYTLLIGSVTYSMNPAVQSNLPFDPRKDLTPVAILGNTPMVLTVSATNDKAKDLKQFLETAKGGGLFYAATGPGSVNHFAAELFKQNSGVEMDVVHFKGGSEAMIDVIGGHVDMFFSSITQALPQIQGGQLRGLAVTSDKRNPGLPDVPTLAEEGIEKSEVQQWWGIFVPAGTPAELMTKLNADINEAMTSEQGKEFLSRDGGVPTPMTLEQSHDYVIGEIDRWTAVAKATGIKDE